MGKEELFSAEKRNYRFVQTSLQTICTGEQVAGFKDIQTGKLEEIMLIKSPKDLDDFKNTYGITEEIEKEY